LPLKKKTRQSYHKVQKRNVIIQSDVDHIVNFVYELQDSQKGYWNINLKGGNLSGSVKELEKSGFVLIKEEKLLQHGCNNFLVEDILSGKSITKTEFPKSWDVDKIMEKIFEAYDSLGNFEIESDIKRLRKSGRTKEGLEILLVLDVCDDRNGLKLVTAIPTFDL